MYVVRNIKGNALFTNKVPMEKRQTYEKPPPMVSGSLDGTLSVNEFTKIFTCPEVKGLKSD